MEWVETTGKSVDEAVDAALDQLGVAEDDAEVEVLEEPKPGLFGRIRGEARVRVRVRPTQPRPKEDHRERRRRRPGEPAEGAAVPSSPDTPRSSTRRDAGEGTRSRNGSGASRPREKGTNMDEPVPLTNQAKEAEEFLKGLVDQFGLDGNVSSEILDEDNFEIRIDGGDLGLLIGPKGVTLSAVQELTRTVVQRKLNAHNGRLLVDVSGYRQKRKIALERFTRDVADQVLSSGQRRLLEPMSAADRKIVHDTANAIEGVSTVSEGEEPRRRVVILPQS
ncbi:MAG TPA: RNA-binding cell elongation regulator Jag/EloR [Acidimicrobiales bacterium]|nr:RNA-binding cell elongation regulator Jag/EloR [Acidimicrobiales bacterium]